MTRDNRRRTARPTTTVAAPHPAPAADTGSIIAAASSAHLISSPPAPCSPAHTSTHTDTYASSCDAGSM